MAKRSWTRNLPYAIVGVIVVFWLEGFFGSVPGPPFPADLSARMPTNERIFITIVDDLAARYQSAPNEMAKGATRPVRRGALEEAFKQNMGADKWLGFVTTLSSTNSGKGVLTVKIADRVSLGTMNNEISDSMTAHTLIDPETPLYAAAVNLRVGQWVVFSGSFVPSATDFYEEDSVTQEGSMTEPEFLFAFTDIAPAP